MYSGTTFRHDSGNIVGVHQAIDRAARRHLKKYIDKATPFPLISQILHFEGKNGPDGIKRKSPSKDEPWHYIDPANDNDRSLIGIMNDHMVNLSQALMNDNNERAAFEAAWLAHAIVDGLTPAHHYPLNDKIEELWGKPHHERTTIKDKNIIKGSNRRDTLSKNWQYWGSGGVFTAHIGFELGVASTIASLRFNDALPTEADIQRVETEGFEATFMRALRTVDALKMYDAFGKKGWTRQLATQTRKVLIPEIIKTVCLAWYCAAVTPQGAR